MIIFDLQILVIFQIQFKKEFELQNLNREQNADAVFNLDFGWLVERESDRICIKRWIQFLAGFKDVF